MNTRWLPYSLSRKAAPALLAAILFTIACPSLAAPAPEQEYYWWQDEIRQVAAAWSAATTGHVAQWPRMTAAAGSGTLPLPPAGSPITCDGRLDEPAWSQATSFPVGPIFERWTAGPFCLQVHVCRDEKNLYVALDSPRDLSSLGALTADGELFRLNDHPVRIGSPEIPAEAMNVTSSGHQVIEWSVPLTNQVRLSFPLEMVRRRGGRLPTGLKPLGLDRLAVAGAARDYRKPYLWLAPVTIALLPDAAGVRLQADVKAGQTDSSSQSTPTFAVHLKVRVASEQEQQLPACPGFVSKALQGAVIPYHWQHTRKKRVYELHGFRYVADARAVVSNAHKIAQRRAGQISSDAVDPKALNAVATELRRTSPLDAGYRQLYCRARQLRSDAHKQLLDAPLLFVKRHPYFAGHIYDDYYTWHPGGGIYVLENPNADISAHSVRPIIDAHTDQTLGAGVYRDPDLSWDGQRLVFAYRPGAQSVTSVYAINVDGSKLNRLTSSDKYNDITPAFLPDGRIAFTSTRPRALVPCFNSGVDTLHTMNGDGSHIKSISVNNVNEFDPAVLADGRILYGRWEYVDKTALYMQSLWTMLPDGTMEEALFGNNLARPTAILDARPVPGRQEVVASLTPHNGQAVGAIGMIDATKGKNSVQAIFNFTPEYPIEMDQGLRCGPSDPWALSPDDVLISNNAIGAHGIIELVDRYGCRELIQCDPEISCYAPILVKARSRPPAVTPRVHDEPTGEFFLIDIYRGLPGVERGSIKRLRILEETARTSGIPAGGRWWNQAFLVSWQGAYIIKNILGTVPVHPDGSARFRVPAGRAVYFEALDAEGREVQRMRTFVQAAPGTTRSCVGCHEDKRTAPRIDHTPQALLVPPAEPEPESWGSGYIDYATMIQPILDRHCVSCHGGPQGMAGGIDLSGGWTWAFNISYETLIKHRLTGFLNCHNSSTHTSEVLPPRTIGSGAAPLAEIVSSRCDYLPPADRQLLFAWMDTNSNYFGTWDYSPHATCGAILKLRQPLARVMSDAGCTKCHQAGFIGNDWINLQKPEWSRILRAPLAKGGEGLGLAFCRQRRARNGYPLIDQRVQPPDIVKPSIQPEWDPSGDVHVSFDSPEDPHYQSMLDAIRRARAEALAAPRIDMPGAEIVPGECRMQNVAPLPAELPALNAEVQEDGQVELHWTLAADDIGLQYELHRAHQPDFVPSAETQIGLTTSGRFLDRDPPAGPQYYALVATSGDQRSQPVRASVIVPAPQPPAVPRNLVAEEFPGRIRLRWVPVESTAAGYSVYRTKQDATVAVCLTPDPITHVEFDDVHVEPGQSYKYVVRAVSRHGMMSGPSPAVEAVPRPFIREPVFVSDLSDSGTARLLDGTVVTATLHGDAEIAQHSLQLRASGFASFAHASVFDVSVPFSFECWVRIDRESQMPVLLCSGSFQGSGWFLQRYGRGWRWHLAPVSCDGGQPVVGRWTHLAGTYDGDVARLYQDGKQVASVACPASPRPANAPLLFGQYSAQQPAYQVQGSLAGVRLYQRILAPDEIVAHHRDGAPQ